MLYNYLFQVILIIYSLINATRIFFPFGINYMSNAALGTVENTRPQWQPVSLEGIHI